MTEIITVNESLAPAAELTSGLLEEFIQYIDTESEKTRRTYITNLRQFKAWLNYARVTAPTAEDIRRYRDYLLSEHRAILLDLAADSGWT